jgi:thioredoxin-related protein
MIRNLFFLTFVLLMLNTCTEKDYQPIYTPVSSFDPTRDAEKDIQLALVEAKRTQRNVLLDIGGEWCTWCHKLDTFFVQNKDVAEFMHQNYVVVKINYSAENKNEKILSKYPEIPGYPHLFVLDAEGHLLHSQGTGKLEEGNHHDREKVFKFLKQWNPKKN